MEKHFLHKTCDSTHAYNIMKSLQPNVPLDMTYYLPKQPLSELQNEAECVHHEPQGES